ncbi:MAG: hypothetical protein KKE11_06790 [Gammaproteobacteria bacterium]|nr:hypothetical protein [Gammaproteobacteria bacterium]
MKIIFIILRMLLVLMISSVVWANPIELRSDSELMNTIRHYSAAILFVGNGAKSQYADINSTLSKVDAVVSNLNSLYGEGRWIAVFGGDAYVADKPDIAHIVRYLKEVQGVPVLAVQSDVVVGWGGVDKYIDYVRYIPTVRVPVLDLHGKPVFENDEVKTNILWGGFIDGKPAGPTGTYLGDAFINEVNPVIKMVVAIGGGPITLEEIQYAYEHGVDIEYVRSEARYPEVNGLYGPVDSWVGSIDSVVKHLGAFLDFDVRVYDPTHFFSIKKNLY